MFDTAGRLIGVCIAADQRDQRGLYSGLQPIHDLLDQVKLSHLHPQAGSLATREAATATTRIEELAFDDDDSTTEELSGPFASSKSRSELEDSLERPKLAAATLGIPAMNDSDSTNEVDPKMESEVVCIIRPLNNPRGASRVVIINRASTKFLSQLSGELEQQAKPTSAVVREAKYATTSSATATPRAFRRTR